MLRGRDIFRFWLFVFLRGQVLEAVGRKDFAARQRFGAVSQAEIAAAKSQPVRAIQPSLDLHVRSPKTGADFFAWYTPTISFPAHRVILGHLAGDAHTQNFL